MTNWEYFDKFDDINKRYLPNEGDGDTLATQAVTAVAKLVYRWYNDGDVFDNTSGYLKGFCNNISGSANWLALHVEGAKDILDGVYDCHNESDYEDLLRDLADFVLDEDLLEELNKETKVGSAYSEPGVYKFEEIDDWEY